MELKLFRRHLKAFLFHSVYGHQDTDCLCDAPSVLGAYVIQVPRLQKGFRSGEETEAKSDRKSNSSYG